MKHQYRLAAAMLAILLFCSAAVLPMNAVGFDAFEEKKTYTQGQFKDVGEENWFAENVAAVYRLGLMIGTADDSFSPDGMVTAAEIYTLIARIYAIYTEDPMADFSAASPWYSPYVTYGIAHGLIPAETADRPAAYFGQSVTRAFMVEAFSALPDEMWAEINLVDDGAIPDVSMDEEYAADVYRAYRAGILVGTDGNVFSAEKGVTRAEIAAIVGRLVVPSQRLRVTLQNPTTVILYAANGSSRIVPYEETEQYYLRGWKDTPYPTETPSVTVLLNEASLDPLKTGYTPLDAKIDAVFAKIIKPAMTTEEKVRACYDYLINHFSYGRSEASGWYRPIYANNPYDSPSPGLICTPVPALASSRGYEYFFRALGEHALEAYAVLYASEMLSGTHGWCDHYSLTFVVMMRRIGLQCFPVYASAKNGNTYGVHMLTFITVGGVDYIFDPQIEDVLVQSTGICSYKRYGKTIEELKDHYRDFDLMEDCRQLFGPFSYDAAKMQAILNS